MARKSQNLVCVTTDKGGQKGRFVQSGTVYERFYGILRIYDGTTVHIYSDEITEISFLAEEEEDDVAKERWESNRPGYTGCIVMDVAGAAKEPYDEDVVILARLDYEAIGTPEQGRAMAAAPEMLDALEGIAKGAEVRTFASGDATIIPQGLLLGINEVIKKARGGDA